MPNKINSSGDRREIVFTRDHAKRALGSDNDTLAALFDVTSLSDLPRYVVSLLAAVAFGRITPKEMLTVTQTIVRP